MIIYGVIATPARLKIICSSVKAIKNKTDTTLIFNVLPLGDDTASKPPNVMNTVIPAPIVIRIRYVSSLFAAYTPKAIRPAIAMEIISVIKFIFIK